MFGFASDGSTAPSLLSPRTPASGESSLLVNEAETVEPRLDLPSLDTPGGFGGFDPYFGLGTSSAPKTGSRAEQPPSVFDNEPAIMEDPVFDVDDNGFLYPVMSEVIQGAHAGEEVELQFLDDTDLSGIDATEHQTGTAGGMQDQQDIPLDDDVFMSGGDEQALPSNPPITPQPTDQGVPAQERVTSSAHPTEELSETAEAPQRRVRATKLLRPDQKTELSNRDLTDWNQNYLANMAAALKSGENQTSLSDARKKAEFWVLHQGLGNVASDFAADRIPHPLALFSGHSLLGLLSEPKSGTKRSHGSSIEDDDQEEARRIRARTSSQEGVARGNEGEGLLFGDDDGLMLQGDDVNFESEVGRHAPPPLTDHSSGMPWNISASRHSSARPGSGLILRLSSSVGGLAGGLELGPPSSFGRPGSRFTSASPLLGKGLSIPRLGSQEILDSSQLTSNEGEYGDLDAKLGIDADPDFELYGRSALIDTQTAAQSRSIAATLENEAYNFLLYVNTKIESRGEGQQAAEEDDEGMTQEKITFAELLPPAQNSKIVGAQGLLHVLTLATKGLLEVYQAEPFGEIEIAVVGSQA